MKESMWKTDGNQAELRLPGLTATLDLSRFDLGFTNLEIDGSRSSSKVLGVTVHSGVPGRTVDDKRNDAPMESYVRGSQLVAIYAPTVDRPVGFQIEWEAQSGESGLVILDVIISVQTPLLETYPEVAVTSELQCRELSFNANGSTTESFALQDKEHQSEDTGISLASLSEGDSEFGLFYSEMVHPTDFLSWQGLPQAEGATTSWKLCDHFMEKGVIRRLRARGILVLDRACSRDFALELARKEFRRLEAELPPLTA